MKQATEKMIKVTANAGAEYIPGILVLAEAETDQDIIDCEFWKTKEGNLFYNDIDSFQSLISDGYTPYQPIIISKTQKISENDKCLHVHSKKIFTADASCFIDDVTIMGDKIIAPSSYFKLNTVQFIKIHKIKDGDEVLVKVDEFLHTNPGTFYVQEPLVLVPPVQDWEKEFEKCKASPYYFATTYYMINNQPFTTHLSEDEFNSQFNNLKQS